MPEARKDMIVQVSTVQRTGTQFQGGLMNFQPVLQVLPDCLPRSGSESSLLLLQLGLPQNLQGVLLRFAVILLYLSVFQGDLGDPASVLALEDAALSMAATSVFLLWHNLNLSVHDREGL